MAAYLAAPHNLPFAVALGIMLGLSLLEVLSTLFGAALSQLLDTVVPEVDGLLGDVDLAAQSSSLSSLPEMAAQLLVWINLGRVPALILLLLFLTGFGCVGVALQQSCVALLGEPLPSWLAAVAATLLALPWLHLSGRVLSDVMPEQETTAVTRNSLVGKVATIIGGAARLGSPAQAKLTDPHGQTHYVLVEPEEPHEVLCAGSEVVLLALDGAVFKAVGGMSAPDSERPQG